MIGKQNPSVVVLSDIHLGTYGAHAEELISYLNTVNPEILILNGDIIDMWQFKKSYFPAAHTKIIQSILQKITNGVQVYYISGNHDDRMRKFGEFSLGNFHLLDKLTLDLDGKKYWFFHGDVFDNSVNHSRWIAKLGGKAYDMLIRINRMINLILKSLNRQPYSFSKKIKDNVKKAVKYIHDFEQTAIDIAMENDFDYVVCGHIHKPIIRDYIKGTKKVTYMNSGDWVESLTALEYCNKEWRIYQHSQEVKLPVTQKRINLQAKLDVA